MSSRSSADYLAQYLAEHGLQPPPFRSESDFYAETNDVKRGVTFIAGQEFVPGFSDAHEDWTSNKSDCMGELSRIFTPCDNGPKCEREAASPDEAIAEQEPLENSAAAEERELPRFEYSDEAPKLQEETKRHLELTSHRSEKPPVTIGNHMLDMFRNKLVAKVKKVNLKKFTIKAEVIHKAHAFTVKARIYRHQHEHSTGTVMEFQRRSGDIVAFCKVYRKVVGHLEGHPCDDPDWDTALPDEIPHAPKERFDPLLDMLAFSQCVRLQAEAALALAEMVSNPMVVAQLRKPCYRSVLERLRQVDDFSVAYPASRMLKV